jgi:hypothetical protein
MASVKGNVDLYLGIEKLFNNDDGDDLLFSQVADEVEEQLSGKIGESRFSFVKEDELKSVQDFLKRQG